MRVEDPGGGWSATTNFETMSHQQLYDMVANSDPSSVQSIGDTLNTASTQVSSVADDLNTHLSKLEWNGSAAEAFQTWARQVVQAADDLSIFHNNAGLAVQTAGSTLSSVKAAMPPVPKNEMDLVAAYKRQQLISANPGQLPTVIGGRVQPPSAVSTTPHFGGGITQAQAYAAQTAVDQAHQEAITQMERLGGAYVGATQTMDLNAEPVFPPPPANVMPPQGAGIDGSTYVQGPTGGGTTTTRRVTGTGSVTGTTSVTSSTNNGNNGGGQVVRQPTGPGRGPGSTLQGVNPPTTGSGTGTVHTPGGGPTGGSGGGGKSGGGGVITPPPGTGGTGRIGGGSGTGRSGSPGGSGEGGGSFGSGGEGGGSAGESGISGGLKGETGISGGMAESGLGGGGGSVGGGIGGRGLGGSVGGSVGGSSESGVVGEGATGSTTARAGYSSEGSGTAAGGAAAGESSTSGGMMGGGGMGGLANAAGRGRKRGGRAGYLAEDEETWNAAKGQSNPAVIE